jgi:DNA repair exonuclease SbcCD ATPase subunit
MGKFLVILAIVLTAASAVLGYLNQVKLAEVKKRAADAEINVGQTKTQLAKVQGDLKTASQNLANTVAEKDQLTSKLSGIQAEFEKSKGQVAQLTNDRTSLETQISQLTADLQAKTQELEQKSVPGSSSPAEGGLDQQAQLAEQQTLITKLQGDLDAARSQVATFQREKEDRMRQKMRNGLEGRILAVNPAWNFVVLSLGDKNGVVNNAELLVKRGTQLIGKVRVTSVEPSTSIADIVANSVPQGTTISPGDDVIYQSVEE